MTEPLLITSHCDWTEEKIAQVYAEIEKIAYEELELEGQVYPNQLEIISSEQMVDAYSSIGLPVHYSHWSFGKDFLKTFQAYEKGRQGLAYEIVINSSPCISYLMEDNSMMMQALVIAHAAFGHNAVFKNNECFKQWTSAGSIIDYMSFARDYIRKCEDRYGPEEVEMVLDAAHALAPHGVDKFKRKHKPRMSEEARLKKLIEEDDKKQVDMDIVLKKTSFQEEQDIVSEDDAEEEENLLYFIMKESPNLEQWKREIIRIVYKVNQYFYPQGQCVTGDQLVATGQGLLRLDELISKDGYVENNEIQLLTEGDRFTPISHTYLKRKAKVVKVRTASGREYIGTPEHPLMALAGTQHEMKCLGEMNLGDHLVLQPSYKNVFSEKEVSLDSEMSSDKVECSMCGFESHFLPTHIAQTHKTDPSLYEGPLSSDSHRANKSSNKPTKFPSTLNVEMGELVAYLQQMTLPSGYQSVFSFYADTSLQSRYSSILKSQFGISIGEATTFSSWGLRKFIEQNFDLTSVPKCIRQSPKPVVVAYLKALFDYRSVVRTDLSSFKFRTYDSTMAQQVQALLIGLGIVSSIAVESFVTVAAMCEAMGIEHTGERLQATVFCLQILPSYKKVFEEVVGSNLNLSPFAGNVRVASKDLIPGAKALLDEVIAYVAEQRAVHHDSTRGLFYANKKRDGLLIKQQSIPKIDDLPLVRAMEISFEDIARDKEAFNIACSLPCEASQKLKSLLSLADGCFYDRVVSIEDLDELHDVYDVTVPENHLFWMGGLISHNTKNLNEGFASFTHYYIMTRLEEKGILSSDAYIAFLDSHASVLYQPEYDKRWYSGINPYTLGFNILMDLKRICENPTEEDRDWFPQLIGRRWIEVIKEAVFGHRDDSFIAQYLSPAVIRKMGLFSVKVTSDDDGDREAIVSDIHDETGYKQVRIDLARSCERINYVPQIYVVGADLEGDRTLHLKYRPYRGRALDIESAELVADYIDYLWGYQVVLDDGQEDDDEDIAYIIE